MEVSEEITVQASSEELGFQHQHPSSTDNGDSDPETSENHHCGGNDAELGFPEPRGSDSDFAASDLVLSEKDASLGLKESEDGSPESDSEAKREGGAVEGDGGDGSKSGRGSQNEDGDGDGDGDVSDRELGEKEREESAESDRGLEEERELPIETELAGEGVGDRSESDEGNEEDLRNDGESVKENEVDNGGGSDEPERRDDRFGARKYQYPVRPEAEDCAFYVKTGNCKFGSNCKFNHPARRKPNHQPAKERTREKERERDDSAEKPASQSECKFYLRSGGCKFGKACKYNHPRGKTTPAVLPVLEFNFVGLPIRTGEKECPYYMRTGSCKYGAHCRFNHPDPTVAAGLDTAARYGNGPVPLQGGSQPSMQPSWSSPRSMTEAPPPPPAPPSAPAPFVPMMVPPSQVTPTQSSEWNGYQAPVYLPPERNMPPPPGPYAMNNLPIETNIYKHHHSSQKQADDYPERPGQPDCSYFLKTRDCKFKSNCKYNHPKTRVSSNTPCTLSDKGLPIRPDQNICAHFSRYGICKYGPACKYDHSPLKPASIVSGGDNNNQTPYSHPAMTIEGGGMSRSGSRSEITIQQ